MTMQKEQYMKLSFSGNKYKDLILNQYS